MAATQHTHMQHNIIEQRCRHCNNTKTLEDSPKECVTHHAVRFGRIEHVLPDSAAEAAGVWDGDLLVFVGSTNVTEIDRDRVKALLR